MLKFSPPSHKGKIMKERFIFLLRSSFSNKPKTSINPQTKIIDTLTSVIIVP